MPKKRKNGGKTRHNRGNSKSIQCDVTGKMISKDKAIKRKISFPLISIAAQRDVRDACYYDRMQIPRIIIKKQYCISEAHFHHKIAKRQKQKRKDRSPPNEVVKRWTAEMKKEARRERLIRF